VIGAGLAVLALSAPARAGRPTDGTGLFSFDASDVIESVDGPAGLVRVHYSVNGPNQVRMTDADKDGVPDFAWQVATTAEAVLELYEATGFRLPISESEMGLTELGGSDALDFYLVDFGGSADGQFGLDTCRDGVCSGYMVMENDFSGYGYANLTTAIRTLTSHELFHGVQFAYTDDEPSWMAEGTATWADYLFDPASDDFLWLASLYMDDPTRGLDRSPSGVSAWDYGTSLFFSFLDQTLGTQSMVDLQEQMGALGGGDASLDALQATIEDQGSTLPEVWTTFADWNLASGERAGVAESYPFAADLPGITARNEGASLDETDRVYPLATLYLRIDHPGGELWWGTADDPTGLALSLHAVADGAADGPVDEASDVFWPDAPGAMLLGDLPAGGYWVAMSQPDLGDGGSVALSYCMGTADALAPCGLSVGGGDTADTGGEPPKTKGCGCSGVGGVNAAWLPGLLGLLVVGRRRRR